MTGPPSLPERLATRLDGAIVYSTPARDWLASLGTPADRIHVVGWGPDTSFGLFTEIADQNRPAETGTPFVVSTGKASRDVTVLVRALAACGLPGRVLVSPAMRSELKASMAVPGNIELVDALPSNADALSFTYGHVEESLRMADIIAIPLEHQWAYGGMTELIDAMACAKPVVMTENPMNGVDVEAVGCGLSVGVGHFEGWVEALTTLAGRGPALAEMGRRGRDFCEHGFNQERFGKALLRICEGVLGGAG
jgi:glycosyltransferase involved in cell wall biosynthesis